MPKSPCACSSDPSPAGRPRLSSWLKTFATVVLLLGGGGHGAEAQPASLTVASHFGGFTNAFAIDGDQLYALQANAFKAFDISGAQPVGQGFLLFDGEPGAIALDGSRGYLALADRLEIVDLAGPSQLGTFQASSTLRDLDAEGDLVFLILDTGDLHIVDATDAAAPVPIGSLNGLDAQAVTVDGDVAFLATDAGLNVIDISDPTLPTSLGSLDSGEQRDVVVEGNLAVLFGRSANSLQIIDVSTPAAPTLLSDLGGGLSFTQALLDGDRLYAIESNGLEVFDITDPTAPAGLGTLELPFNTDFGLQPGQDRALIAPFGQIRFVDISDETLPAFDGGPESPSFITDHMQIDGELLVAADDGFWRYDVSDPSAPQLLEHLDGFPFATRIRADGPLVYLLDRSTLHVLGPDAARTVVLGSLSLPPGFEFTSAFEVRGDRGYLLASSFLLPLDLSDPAAPTAGSQLGLGALVRDVAPIDGSFVAVAVSDFSPQGELAIVDVDDPAAPQLVTTLSFSGRPDEIMLRDNTLFVLASTTDETGFFVHEIDVSDPNTPSLGSSFSGTGTATDLLALADGPLTLAFSTGGELAGALETTLQTTSPEGSTRLVEADGSQQLAAVNLPAPASLSTVGSDETAPITTLNGVKLSSSLEVFGSKGFSLLTRAPSQPTLTVSASVQPRLDCPPEPDEEVVVADILVCADPVDSWLLSTLSLRGLGTGDEAADIERAILRFAGGTSISTFSGDNGQANFDVGVTIGAGQCLGFDLSYELTPVGRECAQEETKTFGIEISGGDLDAQPENFTDGERLPIEPILTSTIELACVHNLNRELGFPEVQPAVDDAQEDEVIAVCRGVYDEQVVINKKDLTVRSFDGPLVTFLGVEEDVACGDSGGAIDRVTISEDGVRLEGFTITGARHGVVISGKDAQVIGNLIGGNTGDGVRVTGAASTRAFISGNEIGESLSAVGDDPLPGGRNGGDGVSLLDGGADQVVNNEIFGNCVHGVEIIGGSAFAGSIATEPIATGPTGKQAGGNGNAVLGNVVRGNLVDGVHIENSGDHQIGNAGGGGNFIAGNGDDGVEIVGEAADGNQVLGNRIGTSPDEGPVANGGHGVHIHGGADGTVIGALPDGDACSGACNAISLNTGDGIRIGVNEIAADRPLDTQILGNFIGVDIDGQQLTEPDPGNGDPLVGNSVGVQAFFIGRTTIQGNLISGQRSHGLRIRNGAATENVDAVVEDNRIGTELGGAEVLIGADGEPFGNRGSGIVLEGFADVTLEKNLVAGNNLDEADPGAGILLDTSIKPVVIDDNKVGTNRAGSAALGNGRAGLWIRDSDRVDVIGNLVSGNPLGVVFELTEGSNNGDDLDFDNNVVGLNEDRDQKLGNGTGVFISSSVDLRTMNNIIAGNDGDGILIFGLTGTDPLPSDTLLTLGNNKIGTTSGLDDFGNGLAGIRLVGAQANDIGFLEDRDGILPQPNLINFNGTGIVLAAGSSENRIGANSIQNNRNDGVLVDNSSLNMIGATSDGLGNIISNNGDSGTGDGVAVVNSEAVSIRGNVMDGNADLPIDLGDDGPTANDEVPQATADDDIGANLLQNFPKLFFSRNGNNIDIFGTLTTQPGNYVVDVYVGECVDGSGTGSLERLLGTIEVTVPVDRIGVVQQTFQDPDPISAIVATATPVIDNPLGGVIDLGTSEVSQCLEPLPENPIFQDGFEQGDTSSWSSTEIGGPGT